MTRARKDYYAVLHVQPGAPVEIIRASYRTLMQRLKAHPDLGGDAAAAAEINEAYAVLKDPTRRAAYDASLARAADPAAAEPPVARSRTARRAASDAPAAAAPRHPADGSACPFCGLARLAAPDKTTDASCARCGSPLVTAVVPLERHDPAQRVMHRVAKDEPLRFFTHWRERNPHAGVLVDLSMTGLRFAAPERLEPQQVVRVECALFSAVVRVAHSERRGRKALFQIGAQFVTVQFHRQRGSLVSIPV